MKVLVIFNPKAGLKNNSEIDTIQDFLNNNKIEYDLITTTIDKGPYKILSNKDDVYDVIIACGGDGTVSETIHGMHDFSYTCPLLILPIGTSNELAQNLGIKDYSLTNTLNNIFNNNIKTMDYGLIENVTTFIYALTFGNFTEVTYKTPQKMKNWLGFRAYVLYAFLSFRKIKTYRLKIKANQMVLSGNYVFGAISNSATIGSILHYPKDDISLSDGVFEVLLISKPNSIKEIRLILTGLIQKDYSSQMFTTFQTDKMTIESKNDIAWNTDGEYAGTYKKIHVKNLNKKIKLLV